MLVVCFFFASANVATAQTTTVDTTEAKPFFAGYPIAFFTPETRWGFGAAGVYNFFPGENKSKRPSQLQVGGAYTLNRQILSFCFYNIFLNDDMHNFFGEIAYYDYFYQFYGIGNETIFEDEELYSVRFPRVQINYLRKLKKDFFIGGFYHFDNYNITDIESEGILERESIAGADGNVISRVGLLARYDNRDNIFYPSKGVFATFKLGANTSILGATEDYQEISVDVSYYKSIKRNIFAFNFWTGMQFGEVPFQELLALGGSNKARGIIRGRFRDQQVILFQGEYRFPIYKRFSGTAFASSGNVFSSESDSFSESWKLNYGLGLRFLLDKKSETNKTNIRVDFALGSDEPAFYFTVNEAF